MALERLAARNYQIVSQLLADTARAAERPGAHPL
jgi:hypothetical protein